MKEVILNDKYAHCNDKECHDGEHFCNQAMKENSFYKNAKLYKGLEVIQRPTYEELEKENAELKTDYEVLSCSVGDFGELQDKLEEEQRKNNGLSDNLAKAKELIREIIDTPVFNQIGGELYENEVYTELVEKAEQFLGEVEK